MPTKCFILKTLNFSTDGINATTAASSTVAGIPGEFVDGLKKAGYLQPVSAQAMAKVIEGEGHITVAGIRFVFTVEEVAQLVDELGLKQDDLAPYLSKLPPAATAENKMLAGAEENKQAGATVVLQGGPLTSETVEQLANELGADVQSTVASDGGNDENAGEDDKTPGETPPEKPEISAAGATAEPRAQQRAVEIPADWRKLEWQDLAKLAARVSSTPITNKKSAVTAIEAELLLRSEGK